MSRAGLALLLVACGTGSVAAPANENDGVEVKPRLHARIWTVDDVALFRWFFDAKRKEDCAFVDAGITHAGPGPTYWCLPRDSVMHDATGGLAIFGDNNCTIPRALALPQEKTSYVIVRGANSCAEPLRVFRPEPPETIKPYVLDGTKCVQASAALSTYPLGEEIPLDSFVSAVESISDLGGPIARLELATKDGSRQTIGGYDLARKLVVTVVDQGGLDPRWLPARLAFEGAGTVLFGDAECKTKVPTKVARDAICPLGASFAFKGNCGEGEYRALGEPVDTATLFETSALGTCVPANEKGVLAYRPGPAMTRSEFNKASPIDIGVGRIRLRHSSAGEDAVVATGFFDSQLQTPCTPTVAIDGETRCLPGESAAVHLFANDACTQPAYELPDNGCPNQPPLPKWVNDEGRAYRVKYRVTALHEKSGKACVPHKRIDASSTLVEVEEHPPAEFAVVTEAMR